MKIICFVCTGNICRSAMAHHYLQKRLYDVRKQNDVIVNSCGTNAYTGDKITEFACQAIASYGVDAKNHRATNIYESDILKSDLILCMTNSHKKNIINIYPGLKNKVFTLKEYVGNDDSYDDIDDPWGYGINVYNSCAAEIVKYVDKLIDKILRGEL